MTLNYFYNKTLALKIIENSYLIHCTNKGKFIWSSLSVNETEEHSQET